MVACTSPIYSEPSGPVQLIANRQRAVYVTSPGIVYGPPELCHERQQSCRPLSSSGCASCTVGSAQMLPTTRPRQQSSKVRHASSNEGIEGCEIHPAAIESFQHALDLIASTPRATCRVRSISSCAHGLNFANKVSLCFDTHIAIPGNRPLDARDAHAWTRTGSKAVIRVETTACLPAPPRSKTIRSARAPRRTAGCTAA